MSLITFDYTCKTCEIDYDNLRVERSEQDKQRCGKCKTLIFKKLAAPPTTFKFADRSAVKSRKKVSLRGPNPGVTRPMTAADV